MTAVLPDPDVLEGARPVPRLVEAEPAPGDPVPASSGRVPAAPAALRRLAAVPGFFTYLGVALAAVGVVTLTVAWGKVAGLTSVALQVPFVVSAGFGGLALVMVGLTVINVAAKQADAAERTRQLGELRDLLAELRRTVEEDR